MKKIVKKTVAKKPMAKKPMMKSGGAKKTLKKYQGDVDSSSVKSYENKKILDDQFKEGVKNSREMMYNELKKLKEQEQNRQNTDRLNQMYPNYKMGLDGEVIPIKRKGGTAAKPKMKKGGSTDKKWIQKAINPAHKGYCTPMTKPTCTPKRKALAKTLKKMAKNR